MAARLAEHYRGGSDAEDARGKPDALRTLIAGWQPITYQPSGAKQKRRVGYFGPAVVPDPRAWLETKLGRPRVYLAEGREFGAERKVL
jgi:hypothetical protein